MMLAGPVRSPVGGPAAASGELRPPIPGRRRRRQHPAALPRPQLRSSDRVMGLPSGDERRSLLDEERAGGVTMTYFAGLDVGLEETAICIIDSDGRIVRELKACSV